MSISNRDQLDAAIDQVAMRMVAVPDNGELTQRIVAALPERTSRLRWLIPQFAAIGALVIAALIWTTGNDNTPESAMLPSSIGTSVIAFAIPVAANEPGTALRTMPLERLERVARMEPRVAAESVDHERSLPAIAALRSLDFDSLAPVSLPEDAPLTLEPLAIADLPLTADSFSPR
jgi:hypothetical protein